MGIYEISAKDNQGNAVQLKQYEGKVLLIVNTAIQCGLTPQYEGLESLYQRYREKGLEILDFPCNQFLEQAPGTDGEIDSFCKLNYGTTFPRFAKVDVNGADTHPLFVYLKQHAGADITDEQAKAFEEKVKAFYTPADESDIKWNFGKFLVDRQGNVVERFSPGLAVETLTKHIEALL